MTPVSPQIKPILEEFIRSTADSDKGDEHNKRRYLFHMKTVRSRCFTRPNWTARVKDAFQRHSPKHTATPPYLLRSAFITWMRSNTTDPEILISAART